MNNYAQMISQLKTPEVMKQLNYIYGQRDGMLVSQSARYTRLLKRHEEIVNNAEGLLMISAPGRTEIGGNTPTITAARCWRRLLPAMTASSTSTLKATPP